VLTLIALNAQINVDLIVIKTKVNYRVMQKSLQKLFAKGRYTLDIFARDIAIKRYAIKKIF